MYEGWKLVRENGTEIVPGTEITSHRGEPAVFHAVTKVPDGCSQGRIQVGDGYGPEYYPSVFGARIVAREAWAARERLEALRAALRAENISWGELAELQSLTAYIEPGDAELLEAAGVPEN
jgi:hypothetical protein